MYFRAVVRIMGGFFLFFLLLLFLSLDVKVARILTTDAMYLSIARSINVDDFTAIS